MSEAVAKLERGQADLVDPGEVMCLICLSLLLEPVSLPCRHVLCLACFQGNLEQASLACPVCRARLGSWARRHSRAGTLVDTALWSLIQTRFPARVAARLAGQEEEEEELQPCVPVHQFAEQGAIRAEWQQQVEREGLEQRLQAEAEERESAELVERLQQEERRAAEEASEQEQRDRELARHLWRESRKEGIVNKKKPMTVMDMLRSQQSPVNLKTNSLPIKRNDETEELDKENLSENVENQTSRLIAEPSKDSPTEVPMIIEECGEEFHLDSATMEEQKLIEKKILQEKLDAEFARKLQDTSNTASPISNSAEKVTNNNKRQTSLMDCSPFLLISNRKTTDKSEDPLGEKQKPAVPRALEPRKLTFNTEKKSNTGKACRKPHRQVPCKRCRACLSPNCGVCSACRDMPRFGGRGLGKQACKGRRCFNPVPGRCNH